MVGGEVGTPLSDVVFGRIKLGSVGQLVERHPAVLRAVSFVLVASIDSDLNPAEQPWAKQQILADSKWARSTTPLIVTGDAIVREHERSPLFTGYDEVWVLDGLAAAPPRGASLVYPRLDEGIPTAVVDYLRGSGSRLGLGDGDEGLNFIAADLDLAARFELIDET